MMLDWSKRALGIAALASSVDARMLVSLPATPANANSATKCAAQLRVINQV